MTVRFYSSVAQQTTLTGAITASSVTVTVGSVTGFPSTTPYTLAIDYGQSNEELVQVNLAAGTTLTVDRAVDGTSGTTHNPGAIVRHVSSARDFADSRAHENATSGVHGVTGNVVGTTDTQTLSNKTLLSPVFNSPTITGTVAGGASYTAPTFTGTTTVSGNMDVNGTAPASSQLDVMGAAAQTGSLQRWLDSTGATLASVAASGLINGFHGGSFSSGVTTGQALIASGVAGQTGDIQQWKNSSGTVLANVDSTGKIIDNAGINVNASSVDNIFFKGFTNATSQILFRVSTSTNTLVLTGDDNGQVVVGNLVELAPLSWTAYTPVWTATTTNPTIGNGTLTGRWMQQGKTVNFAFQLTFGSTTNVGSGTYSFTLPIVSSGNIERTVSGQALGAAGRVVATAPISAASTVVNVFAPTTTTNVTIAALTNAGLLGSAWVSGNFIRISGSYETA